MISLKEYVLNEVSSDLLMKAAKKAKEVGDPRVEKFFAAAIEKARQELDNMEVDAKKVAQNNSKKTFANLKKLGNVEKGWGVSGLNQLFVEKNGREAMITVNTDSSATIMTKGMLSSENLDEFIKYRELGHVADKLKSVMDKMEDSDQILFMNFIIANDSDIKGSRVYGNCHYLYALLFPSQNTTIGVFYGEMARSVNTKAKTTDFTIDKLEDTDLKELVQDVMDAASKK